MTVRPLKTSDIAILMAVAQKSGLPYPDLESESMTLVRVVVDDDDRPLAACGVKPILEAYFWCGDIQRPLAKVHALRLLHDSMMPWLARHGWHEVNGFLPPEWASKFGKRLEKTFGWVRNWPSWTKSF